MQEQKFQINDIVYIIDSWTNDVLEAKITRLFDYNICEVRYSCIIKRDGKSVHSSGVVCRPKNQIWYSIADAFAESDKHTAKALEEYKKEMLAPESILRFPM